MPRDELELKAMVKKAGQVAKDHPTLKVPEVMRVAKFTLEESQDGTLQMSVCRLIDGTPASIAVSHSSALTSTSTITSTSRASGPKTKKIRMTSVAEGRSG